MKFIIMQFSPRSIFLPFRSKCLPQHSALKHPRYVVSFTVRNQVSHPYKTSGKIVRNGNDSKWIVKNVQGSGRDLLSVTNLVVCLLITTKCLSRDWRESNPWSFITKQVYWPLMLRVRSPYVYEPRHKGLWSSGSNVSVLPTSLKTCSERNAVAVVLEGLRTRATFRGVWIYFGWQVHFSATVGVGSKRSQYETCKLDALNKTKVAKCLMVSDDKITSQEKPSYLTHDGVFFKNCGKGFLRPLMSNLVHERTWHLMKSRDSSVGIALGYGLDGRGSRFRFPVGAGNFSLPHHVQNGSGAHPASCPTGTGSFFPGGKAAGAWSWVLTPSSAEVKEWVELYLCSPNTPS
jgi:hypothetical protein